MFGVRAQYIVVIVLNSIILKWFRWTGTGLAEVAH